ncbi:hypothetical protein D9M73_259140 [compost metagenome]
MTLACNSVGERFDCLSLTLEMPFKDNDNAPDAETGWSGKRSKALAFDVLSTVLHMAPRLRCRQAPGPEESWPIFVPFG